MSPSFSKKVNINYCARPFLSRLYKKIYIPLNIVFFENVVIFVKFNLFMLGTR